MSLLLSEGHAYARHYPLATVWYEAQIVRERINNRMVTETTLMHSAMSAIISEKAFPNLKKRLKDLLNGD